MERLGQTAVLGELLVGVLIGPHALGLVKASEVLIVLAEIGVILLLFEIGLDSDLSEMLRAGAQSTVVALVGMAVPFALGFVLARAAGYSGIVAVFLGAALTATSLGITARVLSDLGRLQDPAARVVLGAAVIDDVLGLVVLAVVAGLVETGAFSAAGAILILVKPVAFLGLALVLGSRLAPALLRVVRVMRVRGSLIVAALVFCFLLAAGSEGMGLAPIVGAFAAGLALARTERRVHIEESLRPVTDLFVPLFFVVIGMKVDLATLSPFGPDGWKAPLGMALLTAVAVAGKLASGLVVYKKRVRAWPVAVGMVAPWRRRG